MSDDDLRLHLLDRGTFQEGSGRAWCSYTAFRDHFQKEVMGRQHIVVFDDASWLSSVVTSIKTMLQEEKSDSNVLGHVKFVQRRNTQDANVTLISGEKVFGYPALMRFLGRLFKLYPLDPIDAAIADNFIDLALSEKFLDKKTLPAHIETVNLHLAMRTYVAGYSVSVADLLLYASFHQNPRFTAMKKNGQLPMFFARWSNHIELLAPELSSQPTGNVIDDSQASFDVGIQAGSEKICTRFPPEPSGYLHIGHAKAALLNDLVARQHNGQMIVRFDDTNPSKEKQEFQDSILDDLKTMGISYDIVTYTSDSFPIILEYGRKMIEDGFAFVDDTDGQTMREERIARKESKNRNLSVEENLALWEEMVNGTSRGLECCVRAKMDMQSDNGCLRDPVLFRCKLEPHHRTGSTYNVYPTYDFACPIVDSIEGVSHALRTTEYHDRDDQYYRLIEMLGIRSVKVEDYSRVNFVYTLLSKRKLTWFVNEGYVNGWDDPRMPTFRGMIRRGLEVEALRQFVISMGASKSDNLMYYNKLWNLNKKIIDPIAHRYSAVLRKDLVPLEVTDAASEIVTIQLHPKNPEIGEKAILRSRRIWLEQLDAESVSEGEEVTLMGWGNIIIDTVSRTDDLVTGLSAHLHLEGSVKSTKLKLSWVGEPRTEADQNMEPISVILVQLDYLINVPKLEEDMKFEDVVRNPEETWVEFPALAEPAIRGISQGQTIQINRKGFFRCDRPYISENDPMILLFIPDGKKEKFMQ